MSEQLRTVSYGGGVQSTALLVLAAERRIDFPLFLFANVGADSENPRTLDFVEQYAKPYAAAHGIELVELQRTVRGGHPETLWGRLTKDQSRSLPIPVRMSNGAPGRRSCTADFKIAVVVKEIKRRLFAQGDMSRKRNQHIVHRPAVTAIGFSLDEWERMTSSTPHKCQQLVYPLIDMRLDRHACTQIIHRAGLPVPPKSSCFFCPFHNLREWRRLRDEQPTEFERAVWLEDHLNERRDVLGKDAIYFSALGAQRDQSLRQVVGDETHEQMDMFAVTCDAFSCFT